MSETGGAETPLSWQMRVALTVASALVLITAVQLLTQSSHTDRYFAWTIKPPLTAAFLGAGYVAAFVLTFSASRQTGWAYARIAIAPLVGFLPLMMAATIIHIDRFHLHSGDTTARVAAWAWLVLYGVVLVVLPIALVFQRGGFALARDNARPLPTWLRAAVALQAAVLVPLGIALFAAPDALDVVWPWSLTPLTARAVGSWLVAAGAGAADVAWTNDLPRVRIGMLAYTIFAVCLLLGVARYPHTPDWSDARIWLYLAFFIAVAASGAAILARGRSR